MPGREVTMTPEEQKIYDEFESGGRALLEKAKADAAAIGKDVQEIIGPIVATEQKVEKAVVKGWARIWAGVRAVWVWLMTFFQFLDSPADAQGRSKFSHKRLLSLGCFITSVWFAVRGGWIPALVYFSGAVVLAIISAITKT